jgi:acyl-homoserine-lactone acylase
MRGSATINLSCAMANAFPWAAAPRRWVFNLLDAQFGLSGFAEPFYGSGYLHVVAFDGSRCPDAVTLLSYSQSSEPTSAHFADQTELFSRKQWVTSRFCEADILASPALEIVQLEPDGN